MDGFRPHSGRFSSIGGRDRPRPGPPYLPAPPAPLAVRSDDRLGLALYDLEGIARDRLQLVEAVVVPAAVRRARDEPVRAVVRVDDPVVLERPGDHERLAAEVRQVV